MTAKILLIELFQPFAQYRNPFTFYYAQTYPLPPKSTIIGMLQNAVGDWYGYKRWYKDNGKIKNLWWDNLKISIHGRFESVFWNYQQLIKGEINLVKKGERIILVNQNLPLYNEGIKSQRTPIYQQELFNGHLYLFIQGEESLLNEIYQALTALKKVLYLGRSEDLIYIRNVKLIGATSKREAKKSIWLTYPTYIRAEINTSDGRKRFPIRNEKYPVYSIPTKVLFKNNNLPVKHKSEITKLTDREVNFETVIFTDTDYVIRLSEPVHFEEISIEKNKFRIISDYGWL